MKKDEQELIKATEKWIDAFTRLARISGKDYCFVCGMRAEPIRELLKCYKTKDKDESKK